MNINKLLTIVAGAAMAVMMAGNADAAVTVKVVPWVASDFTIPHDTYAGATTTLKGTVQATAGDTLNWIWDFGDGTPVASGTVYDNYAVEATHAYGGPAGTLYTAQLTVIDQNSGERDTKPYYVLVSDPSLRVQVNLAIDEGLWRLHKEMTRWDDTAYTPAIPVGDWGNGKYTGAVSGLGYPGLFAENIAAFETQGHLQIGAQNDPYTETVQRGLARLLEWISVQSIPYNKSIQSGPGGGWETVVVDVSGSGLGLCSYLPYGDTLYQGGMFIDCLVASGTPNAVALTGPPGVVGRTYSAIVQDMVDWYLYAQYSALPGGGWRYDPGQYPDNSVCQWGAIGLIPAEREWNLNVPQWAKDWNVAWLQASEDEGEWWYAGGFPYQPGNYAWGPYATTPSGMVQMCMDHIGRGTAPWPSWDYSEAFIRNTWDSGDNGYPPQRFYCYGLFSFVKAMLLHWDSVQNVQAPLVMLQSVTDPIGHPPLDWYGDPSEGVAIALVNRQQPGGYWWSSGFWVPNSYQCYFHTAWCTMMLSKTLFTSGSPVAVPSATPNPALANQPITLDGSKSFDKASGHNIVKWEWDLTGDGTYSVSGVSLTTTFPALGTYPVRLRVTDDSSPPLTAEATVSVVVNIPPVAPTANAGGPYVFCQQAAPWFLSGLNSVDPDLGKSEPGSPPDTLSYAWDFGGENTFLDSTSPTPNVTAFFQSKGPGTYVVQLRVTASTASSFPSSGLPNLVSVASATVNVEPVGSSVCSCVTLSYTLDPDNTRNVDLSWTPFLGAASYAIYRSTAQGGPYLSIGTTADTTYADLSAASQQTYYYVIRPRAANGNELCQSNEQKITPHCPPPVVTCTQSPKFNSKHYYRLTADNPCYDEVAQQIYIGDTANGSFIAGPYSDENVVRISQGPAASVKPGAPNTGVTAIVTVVGQATVWAVSPLGETSTPIVVSP